MATGQTINTGGNVGGDDASAERTHIGATGAHIYELVESVDPSTRGGVIDVFGIELGSALRDWHRMTMQHGDANFFHNDDPLDPPLESLLVVPTTAMVPALGPLIAEALVAKGIEVPDRAACLAWDQADRAAGGFGGDPDKEYAYATYCFDPELAAGAIEKRICGVPESIYSALPAEEQVKVRAGRVIGSPTGAATSVAHWVLRNRLTMRVLTERPGRRRRIPMRTVARVGEMWCHYTTPDGGGPARWVARPGRDWMRSQLRQVLREMYYVKPTKHTSQGVVSYSYELKPWTLKIDTLREVEAAMADLVSVVSGDLATTAARELPDAYGQMHGMFPASGTWVLCRNGVLDLNTGRMLPNSPLWFSLSRVEADYDHSLDPLAADTLWMRMLLDQWSDDPGAIDCLQEWFGYILSGRMDLQKAMLILGPGASGKGNIAAVLEALVSGATSTDMHRLNTNFGLAKLYQSGATLAVMGDVRFNAPDATQAVQNLLSVIGQDMVPVDIKYKDEVDAQLPIRFHMSANEFPNIPDNAAAMARRLLLLKTGRSFAGTEDPAMRQRIIANELGQVLRWAVAGLERLNGNGGKFTVAQCHTEMHARIKELMSPTLVFVHECCTPGDAADFVTQDEVYRCWCLWAAQNGHKPGSKTKFIERLTGLPDFPGVRAGKGREVGRVVYGIAAARSASNVFVP